MDLIAIGVIALAFVLLLCLPRPMWQDRKEQARYRETWTWPPK